MSPGDEAAAAARRDSYPPRPVTVEAVVWLVRWEGEGGCVLCE